MHKIAPFLLLAFLLFASCLSFHSDEMPLVPVKIGSKWGYAGKNGKIAIKPQFEEAQPFGGRMADIKLGGKWGCINKKGKIAINPQFEEARIFQEGMAGF